MSVAYTPLSLSIRVRSRRRVHYTITPLRPPPNRVSKSQAIMIMIIAIRCHVYCDVINIRYKRGASTTENTTIIVYRSIRFASDRACRVAAKRLGPDTWPIRLVVREISQRSCRPYTRKTTRITSRFAHVGGGGVDPPLCVVSTRAARAF